MRHCWGTTTMPHTRSGHDQDRSRNMRTRNRRLGPLVQHPPPPGRHHTTTSRIATHNNTKGSGLNKPPQNPGLDILRVVPHLWWGFCTIRSLPPACRRRVAPLLVQFPPFGGGEVAVRGGMAPTSQTTSTKNADNGVSWARWSTFWAKLSRTWCVVRTRTRDSVR